MKTTTKKMNCTHLDICVCLMCRPPHRGRYTTEEYEELKATVPKHAICKHCLYQRYQHAGGHWRGDGLFVGLSCKMEGLSNNMIRSSHYKKGGGPVTDAQATHYSSEFFFERQ